MVNEDARLESLGYTPQLNRVLGEEAAGHGFRLAPLAPNFAGHGAGAKDSYVFGSDCDVAGAATSATLATPFCTSVESAASTSRSLAGARSITSLTAAKLAARGHRGTYLASRCDAAGRAPSSPP